MSEPEGARLSAGRVRNLSVEELDLNPPRQAQTEAGGTGSAAGGGGVFVTGSVGADEEPSPLPDEHELLQTVQHLLEQFGGVILIGPPGTSKTYFAARVAMSLAGSSARVRFVQFHPSYQYEDFVQGYVPKDDGGGFTLEPKHLMQLAADADADENVTYVLVIDELSRGDAARIFGEALTYLERTKRGLKFSLASGDEFSIPLNLIFIATMNALDRGVDEVDAAFERRFAKIAMDPNEAVLIEFLNDSGMDGDLRDRVVEFFRYVNAQAADAPQVALGHTFFYGVSNENDLRFLWEHQLRFFFDKAYRLDRPTHAEVRNRWNAIFAAPVLAEEPAAGDAQPQA